MLGLRCLPLQCMCICNAFFAFSVLFIVFLFFNMTENDIGLDEYEYYDDPQEQDIEKQIASNDIPNPGMDTNYDAQEYNDKVLKWLEEMHPKKSSRTWDTFAVNCNEVNVTLVKHDNFDNCHPLQQLFPEVSVCLPPKKADEKEVNSDARSGRGDWDSIFLITMHTLLQMFPKMGLIDIGSEVGAFSLLAATLKRNAIAIESDRVLVDTIAQSIVLNSDCVEHVTLLHNVLLPNSTLVKEWNQRAVKPAPGVVMTDLLEVVPFTYALLRLDIENAEHRAIMEGGDFFGRVTVPFIMMDWDDLRVKYPEDVEGFINFANASLYEPFTLFMADDDTKVDAEKLEVASWRDWPHYILWRNG